MELYCKNTRELMSTNIDDVAHNMFYKLCIIPPKEYYKPGKNDTKTYKEYKKKMRKQISKIKNFIPLYDIKTKNIYLISSENVYYRVMHQHHRYINKYIKTLVSNVLNKINNGDKDTIIGDEKLDNAYKHKIEKNVDYIDCFNLKIMKKTFYELFFN
jgi:hypothetical protein